MNIRAYGKHEMITNIVKLDSINSQKASNVADAAINL